MYDFKSLSPYDFEVLVRDLLQKEHQQTIESFTVGRDDGIDLRYTGCGDSTIIQCKHYSGSRFSNLVSNIRTKELEKIRRLEPSRYILATSMGLTPANKSTLVKLLNPYCKNTSDILGREDINSLLSKHQDIEKRHNKLWLTSTSVLERIQHSAIHNRTDYTIEALHKIVAYYVQTHSFREAQEILKSQHYCIIAGVPGIGKTILAKMLLIDYAHRGYEAIHISSDIREAYSTYKKGDKQFFYYDDFLGQTSLELKLNKNEEDQLLQFINMVRNSPVARFVLTTREYILNHAKDVYEKLARSYFDARKCVIKLEGYSKWTRARILYNHLYFSNMPKTYLEKIINDKKYLDIINHCNYNPRIIDWMTDAMNVKSLPEDGYIETFMANLNDPVNVWDHAFNSQLTQSSRLVLFALTILPIHVLLEDLRDAFQSIHERGGMQQHDTTQKFQKALNELEDNFIRIDRYGDKRVVRFHNPSIRDYMENFFRKNPNELQDVIPSIVFFDQFMILWGHSSEIYGPSNFHSTILKKPQRFIEALSRGYDCDRCQLIHVANPNHIITKDRRDFDLVERIDFVLDISSVIESEDSDQLIQTTATCFVEHVNDRYGEKHLVFEVASKLIRLNERHSVSQDKIVLAAKSIIFSNLREVSDFSYAIKFEKIFHDFVEPKEIAHITDAFKQRIPELVEDCYSYDDPDSVRELAQDLSDVAKNLNIDVENELDDLEGHAHYLEMEPRSQPDEPDNVDDLTRFEEDMVDQNIDSLFSSLE